MKSNKASTRRIKNILGSPYFLRGIVVLLLVQAIWIALTAHYPMAFDEEFHFGLIKLYGHHLSPFWSGQPEGGDAFGAIARDPSYLYHYLMSFPYRLTTVFTSNQVAQIMVLRALNIAMLASSLPLFRRLLLKTGASRQLVNLCLLLFVLIPIVPFLAAQINYDNLIIPMTALTLLLAVRFTQQFSQRAFNFNLLLGLLALCLLAGVVKYAYLPVFVVIVVYVLACFARQFRGLTQMRQALLASWRANARWSRVGLILLVLLSSGLFVERYGVNLVRYHAPVVDCAQVISEDHCSQYGPWLRDHLLEQSKGGVHANPVAYSQHWLYGMWFRTFFAVDGPLTENQTRAPLLLPAVGSVVFATSGAVALLFGWRRLLRGYKAPVIWLLSAVIVFYAAILWLTDYQMFVQTGQPVAINGRYLLPILPFLMLLMMLAVRELLAARERLGLLLATVAIVSFAWGGGALTFILRSNDAWYWNNRAARTANHVVQRNIGPITPGYDDPTQFLH